MGGLSLREVPDLQEEKTEGSKIEAILVESLRSPLDIEVRRFHRRIIDYGHENPLEMTTILLRYYDHEDNRVQQEARSCLTELSGTRNGMEGIMENMVHPSRNIRKAVQSFLGNKVGAHAITYASLYEQTMLIGAICRRKNIPVDDITALARMSKQTFMDREVMAAVSDIGLCLDLIKHRLRSSEQLRNYVSDLLRLVPDLTRIGAYNAAIEEPLRKAMKASHHRTFDETKEIIDERMKESILRNRLYQLGSVVKENIFARPQGVPDDLQRIDWEELLEMHDLVDAIAALVMAGQKAEAVDMLFAYIEEDLVPTYESNWKARISSKDQAALFSLYNIMVVLLKLAASMSPMAAEDSYQRNMKHLEGEPSIHLVMWPEAIIHMVGADQLSDDKDPSIEAAI